MRTHRRTEDGTATAPPPRRPGGARRARRGRGAAERTGSNRRWWWTGSGNDPARPALCTSPGSLHFRDQTHSGIISGAEGCVSMTLRHFRNAPVETRKRPSYYRVSPRATLRPASLPRYLPPQVPPSTPSAEREGRTHWTHMGLHKVKYNKMFNEQIRISKYETATERRSRTRDHGLRVRKTKEKNQLLKKPGWRTGRTRSQRTGAVVLQREGRALRARQQNSK